ncbi:hypothetical protein B484DRAFT_443396 [Ochromonadaceae sp. CCMP2298]|nr:hypothetical protein B484DRAFT_443396 [Ochromonadaceae sp. CCMP2298]
MNRLPHTRPHWSSLSDCTVLLTPCYHLCLVGWRDAEDMGDGGDMHLREFHRIALHHKPAFAVHMEVCACRVVVSLAQVGMEIYSYTQQRGADGLSYLLQALRRTARLFPAYPRHPGHTEGQNCALQERKSVNKR